MGKSPAERFDPVTETPQTSALLTELNPAPSSYNVTNYYYLFHRGMLASNISNTTKDCEVILQ